MSKRELGTLATVDVDAPRTKRRIEATDEKPAESSRTQNIASKTEDEVIQTKEEGTDEDARLEAVREQGMELYLKVKDAVSSDGRNLAFDFHHLPSKRLYPDYYEKIKRPVTLGQIKTRVAAKGYATLGEVRNDLDQCFLNAQRYNRKDSQIWKDSKTLQRLVRAAFTEMAGGKQTVLRGDEHEGNEGTANAPSTEVDEVKMTKALHRLLTTRLEKLVAKTDDDGNRLSDFFMSLPDPKKWAIYYKTIGKPMCFEKIFRHLKRKEYHLNCAKFAADVELIFSNAMQFNEDHTTIWEAAKTLKEYFHKLMSDLPAPFNLSQYAPVKASSGKIKLKMPGAQPPTTAIDPKKSPVLSSSLTLKLHASTHPAASSSSTLPVARNTASKSSVAPSAPASTTPQPATQTHYPSVAYNYTAPNQTSHYPNATYSQPAATRPATTERSVSAAPVEQAPTLVATSHSHSTSHSPVPSSPQHALKSAVLTLEPAGRRLHLDHGDGVKSWALRLGSDEHAVRVAEVNYLGLEKEDSSDEEEKQEEEEGSDAEMENPAPRRGKSKGRGRGRGGGRGRECHGAGAVRIKDGVKLPPKKPPPQTHVKFDHVEVPPLEDEDEDVWLIQASVGSHVLEVGEKGGAVWKVFVSRIA